MRLPELSQLSDPSHLFLYQHDLAEIHNTNSRSFSCQMYMDRFSTVLQRIQWWTESLGKSVENIKILDLGCAQGNFSLTLAENGFQVFAVDLRLSFLRYMKLKYESGRLFSVNASIAALPFQRTFDIVLLGEVIEHVAYPNILLQSLAKLVSPSGCLILTTPNGNRLLTRLPTLSQITDQSVLVDKQFQPDSDGHLYLLTQSELEKEIQKSGMNVLHHQYFGTPWITGRMKFRVFVKLFPLWCTRYLDRLFLMVPVLAKLFSEGQLIIAQPIKR